MPEYCLNNRGFSKRLPKTPDKRLRKDSSIYWNINKKECKSDNNELEF